MLVSRVMKRHYFHSIKSIFKRNKKLVSYATMAKRKTIINVETHKLLIVRPAHSPINIWCSQCAKTVQMVTPERAAFLTNITPREIYRRVENGKLHFVETDKGELFICCISL